MLETKAHANCPGNKGVNRESCLLDNKILYYILVSIIKALCLISISLKQIFFDIH